MQSKILLGDQICFRLYAASRLVIQSYAHLLKELEITYPQYLVLMVLWENDCQPVNNIAHRLLLETNTITPLLQRMERSGIVVRKQGEQDKRQQIICLSEKGRELEKKAIELIPPGMAKQISICPLKTDDYNNLAKELDTIIESLKVINK